MHSALALCWISLCPRGAVLIIPCLPGVVREHFNHLRQIQSHPFHVQGLACLMHRPGGSWKRLTTLFSGVLKKAVAIELYSPSSQKS